LSNLQEQVNLKIVHETEYLFTEEVFLEPHYLRFKPKSTPHGKLNDFKLSIFPTPTGVAHHFDEEGNLIHFCWFDGMTKSLQIRSESQLITEKYNPLDFLVYPTDFLAIPFSYNKSKKSILQSDLIFENLSDSLIQYGNKVADDSNFNTVQFLVNLTRKIHTDFVVEYREEGPPHQPNEAFELKRGSCRDLTWMQINLLRQMGVAARFVSGYFYFSLDDKAFELHAWLEVFIPGAGWVGFDPSHGMVAGSSHIPIVSSSNYENTLPVTGTIRGKGSSTLQTNVSIEII